VPAAQCLPWPAGCDAAAAASLPEAACTTWVNVFEIGRLSPGESLLIHGGSSGIGVFAVQAARARGSRVVVTAGSDEKCAACLELGADLAVNHRTGDFVARIAEFTSGRGVDLILDMVGSQYFHRNIACLAPGGRLVLIGLQSGSVVGQLNLREIMSRRLTIAGSTLRGRTLAEKARIVGDARAVFWALIDDQSLRPVVHRVFPFSRVADAHRLMEQGSHIGKIILSWSA
jgi:NADPH2:quinone reductase